MSRKQFCINGCKMYFYYSSKLIKCRKYLTYEIYWFIPNNVRRNFPLGTEWMDPTEKEIEKDATCTEDITFKSSGSRSSSSHRMATVFVKLFYQFRCYPIGSLPFVILFRPTQSKIGPFHEDSLATTGCSGGNEDVFRPDVTMDEVV